MLPENRHKRRSSGAFEGGPDGLELLAIGSDRPEEGDGVRVDEWWSD
jgi:hypothetical protein